MTGMPCLASKGPSASFYCTRILIVALLSVSVCEIGQAQQRPPKGPAGQDASELQTQILESTRKMAESAVEQTRKSAESAVEQTRKSAESAVEQTRKIAEQSMQAADRTNHALEVVAGWAVVLFALIVGFASFLGIREIRGLRNEYALHLRKAVDSEIDKHQDQLQMVTAMSIETARVVAEMTSLADKKGPVDKADLPRVHSYVKDVLEKAEKLGHYQTIGWMTAQRALLHYYAGEYVEAFIAQERACEPRMNPNRRADRPYNLACFSAMIYAADSKREDLRVRCVQLLDSLCVSSSQDEVKRQLKMALQDPDLAPILIQEQSLKARIEAATA